MVVGQGTGEVGRTHAGTWTRGGPPEARVLLVEDHGAVRRGLELYLTAEGFRVVGAAPDAETALQMAAETNPHVVVVDVLLPGQSGVELIRRMVAADPAVRAIAFTALADEQVTAALAAGARGFVHKAAPPERLAAAIRTVAAGGTFLDVEHGHEEPTAAPAGAANLTVREREILFLLSQGMTATEIADRLVISRATVRTHVQNARRKLGARTRSQAIALTVGRAAPG